jgi:hypothetical protein
MFCPKCDHNQKATDEQLENMRIERATNRAHHHGIINFTIYSLVTEMCECEEKTEETDILIDVNFDGECAYQPICDVCDKAKQDFATYNERYN